MQVATGSVVMRSGSAKRLSLSHPDAKREAKSEVDDAREVGTVIWAQGSSSELVNLISAYYRLCGSLLKCF